MAAKKPTTLTSTINESDLEYHEPLGSGAGGEVYRVTWKAKKLGNVNAAAKKILLIKDNGEQIEHEISFLQKLKHPNLIEYYGHVVTATHVVIVLEYAAKGSLYDYLKDKSCLPTYLKRKWAIQAARGIKYLTESSVVHRDIKSPNLLITAENTLKICDFGISKDLTSTKTTKSEKGSIQWQAPEIFTENKLSLKADIFALGIVLWELETCEKPYNGKTNTQVMYAVGVLDLRPKIPANCPLILKDLMQQCWHKDRNERPDFDDVISQLQLHVKHQIDTDSWVYACHWVSHQHLAVCTGDCVEVYKVTTEGSHLEYKLTSAEWEGKWVNGVAVSESMPNSMLVICDREPYVYQYPCSQATQEIKKYKIHSDLDLPECIVANAGTAVIGLYGSHTLVVCRLPDFDHQTHLHASVIPINLSITADYLLVLGMEEMVVKPLGDMSQDLCRIRAPDRWKFNSACFGKNATEIHAGCTQYIYHTQYIPHTGLICVHKYIWDGIGKPLYYNTGSVIEIEWDLIPSKLSVSIWGLLAISRYSEVKVYSLE